MICTYSQIWDTFTFLSQAKDGSGWNFDNTPRHLKWHRVGRQFECRKKKFGGGGGSCEKWKFKTIFFSSGTETKNVSRQTTCVTRSWGLQEHCMIQQTSRSQNWQFKVCTKFQSKSRFEWCVLGSLKSELDSFSIKCKSMHVNQPTDVGAGEKLHAQQLNILKFWVRQLSW